MFKSAATVHLDKMHKVTVMDQPVIKIKITQMVHVKKVHKVALVQLVKMVKQADLLQLDKMHKKA